MSTSEDIMMAIQQSGCILSQNPRHLLSGLGSCQVGAHNGYSIGQICI
jgi:hypothetical protein